jgi:hypothetical protein
MATGLYGCTDHAQGCCDDWCAACKSFLDVTPARIKAIKAQKTWRRTGLAVKSGEPDPEGAEAHLQATLALIAATDELLTAEKGE